MESSKKWHLSTEQIQSIKQALIKYTTPLLLVFLVQLQSGQPIEQAMFIVYGAALQMAINILSKLVTEN
jgi:hypothetical protein